MSAPHEAALAELDRRLALCRGAARDEPGPWSWHEEHGRDHTDEGTSYVWVQAPSGHHVAITFLGSGDSTSPEEPQALAAHVASADPTALAALYGWLAEEIRAHVSTYAARGASTMCRVCPTSGRFFRGDACAFATRAFAALGGETGGGERGTPAGHGDAEGGAESNGSASAATDGPPWNAWAPCGHYIAVPWAAFDGPVDEAAPHQAPEVLGWTPDAGLCERRWVLQVVDGDVVLTEHLGRWTWPAAQGSSVAAECALGCPACAAVARSRGAVSDEGTSEGGEGR